MWKKPKYDADGKRHPPNNWAAVWGGKSFSLKGQTGSSHISQEALGNMMKRQMNTTSISSPLNNRI